MLGGRAAAADHDLVFPDRFDRGFRSERMHAPEHRRGADRAQGAADAVRKFEHRGCDIERRRRRLADDELRLDALDRADEIGEGVELQVGQKIGHGEGVDQVRFTRMADLSPMLEGREHVGAPEQFDVSGRAVGPDLFQQVLEANH